MNEEISALIATLHDTQRRIEVLTQGEVDTVVDPEGRTFLLRRAQDRLRHSEAAKQAAILNALPANIALLDSRGVIVSTNEAWRQRSCAYALQGPGHPAGLNYVEICDSAAADDPSGARQAAKGIQSVLSGDAKRFSTEYPCHSAAEKRWFLMTVTPLAADRPNGVVVMHVDITERKRAEEEQLAVQSKLAESEQRLRIIIDTEPECVKVVSKDMVLLDMNAAGLVLLEADSLDAAKARPLLDFIVPEHRTAFADLHARVMRGESGTVEFQVVGLKGGRRWLETHAAPLIGRDGKAASQLAITRDVTVRKETDEQIRRGSEALRRFSSAMDATADAIYLVDRSTMQFIHVNAAACRMQGLTREELLALGPAGVLGIPREELERTYDAIIASGVDAEPLEMLRRRQDGTDAWVELRRHALRSEDGWTIATLVRDVTERKHALHDLHKSEERFRSLTKLSSDWFWEQDEEHRFRSFSGGDNVDGWGPDQSKAVGLHRWDLGGVIPISSSWEEHKGLLDAHKSFRDFEYQRTTVTGTLQYVAASGEPTFDPGGRFTGYRGVATDITQRKLAEARIIRLSRVHAVLSGINSAIVRIREPGELFKEVCRIAISEGEFILARVIEVDLAGNASIAATTEVDTHLYQGMVDEYNRDPGNSGSLLGLALRDRLPLFSNDVAADPRIPNRAALTKEGTYALAMLPLLVGKRLAGTIILRAQAVGAFNDDENRLLMELTGNISLALEHIEQEDRLVIAADERNQALRQLRESERRFSDMLANVEMVAVMLDPQARVTYCNDHLLRLTGRQRDEVIGGDWVALFMPPEAESAKVRVASILAGKPGFAHTENLIVTRAGERRMIRWSHSVLRSAAGEVVGMASIGEDITERKAAQGELLEASRQRGMAEVATNILHNVGNVLNSVNVSASLVAEKIKGSPAAGMAKVAALLREHEADLGSYISSDAKGRHIPAFLQQLALDWQGQQEVVVTELESLRANIDHIKEIVAMQQSHAKVSGAVELVDVRELVEHSLRLNQGSLLKHQVRVVREFEDVPPVSLEKHKALQILVNLVRNAKQACGELEPAKKCITLRIAQVDGRVRISVSDNGAGIAPENLTSIFSHGFTTRKDGHGFGLHSGALAAIELGGSLSVVSDGVGKGATFTLEFGPQPLPVAA